MKNTFSKLIVSGVIASFVALPAVAQTTTVFSQADAAKTRVKKLDENIQNEFDKAREIRDFGSPNQKLGWYGSMSASANATSGNTENIDVGIGARFGHFDGVNGHDVILSYAYGEASKVKNKDSLFASYDYTRSFNPNFYGYGKVRTSRDTFSSYESDTFVGAGLGYRIINTPTTTWALEVGPGWRWLKDNSGKVTEQAAATVGSKIYHELTKTAFLSNDTTVLWSEANTNVTNDLGVNVSLDGGGPLALRTSLLTEYNTDPLPGKKNTDNKLGVSLVYSFK